MNHHALKVQKIVRLTAESVEIVFEIPQNLQESYRFEAGQYVNITLEMEGKKEVRSYSISSSNADLNQIAIAVKEVENGRVSKWLNRTLAENTSIDVSTPQGNFVLHKVSNHHIFFAGGSGITPIMAMIAGILQNPSHTATLYYSNKNAEQTLYFDRLTQWTLENPDRLKVDFIFTQRGHDRISAAHAAKLISLNPSHKVAHYYVCGPNGIITAVEEALQKLSIDKAQFSREYFTAKDADHAESAEVSIGNVAELAKGEKAKIEMKYEGKNVQFECNYDEKIIDAALDAGYDPPYSCMVAACCTCRAMVKNGKVEMVDKDSLTDKEIEKGYVLTCQSLPRTKEVKLNYDE